MLLTFCFSYPAAECAKSCKLFLDMHTQELAALVLLFAGASPRAAAGGLEVKVDGGPGDRRLLVNGAPYFIHGMNWGYTPIGENYSYNLWGQSDAFIEAALAYQQGKGGAHLQKVAA